MSKLDLILGKEGITYPRGAKQQIKELFLELIGEDKQPYDDTLEDGTVVDSEEYNTIAKYLRQKVEDL